MASSSSSSLKDSSTSKERLPSVREDDNPEAFFGGWGKISQNEVKRIHGKLKVLYVIAYVPLHIWEI